jgi:hypothetical protein
MRWLSRSVIAMASGVTLLAILIWIIVGEALGRLNLGGLLPLLGIAVTILIFLAGALVEPNRPDAGDMAVSLAEKLPPQIQKYWRAQQARRGLEHGRQMGVHWRRAAGSSPNPEVAGLLPEEGTLSQLIDLLGSEADRGRLPRLVVTGEMGAGKTAACVLLIVELAGRQGGLPVLFPLATWDPGTPLQAWMTAQLPESIAAFGGTGSGLRGTKYGKDVASILVTGHILPILDGLDEMSDPAAALNRIENELAGMPFVLTCRTTDFSRANAGHVLHQSLVIELQPLAPGEAADILGTYDDADATLAALAEKLRDEPGGPVAAALSSPFMVSLARDSGTTLADLLPATGAPDAVDQIRRHLLGAFVAKAYVLSDDPRITPPQARHYLRFLAAHTDEAGRVAWWRLHRSVPRLAFVVIALCIALAVCSGLAAAFFALFDRPWLGFWIGFSAGVLGALAVELFPQDDPRRARPQLRAIRVPAPNETARILGFGVMGGVALATIAWFLYRSLYYVLVGALLSGGTFAVARYVSQPNDPVRELTPVSMLRADRAAVLITCLAGAISGTLSGFYLGYSFQAGHRPIFDPLAILRQPALVLALTGAIGGFVLSSAGLGLMASGASSWGRFILTRVWLAGRGSLPLKLMRFLEDAYSRGVLRQVNGYYEFRHGSLQRYLAEPSADTTGSRVATAVANTPRSAS